MPPRPGSYERGIAQDFSKSIEYTEKLIGDLLEQLRDGQISFAELRTELNQLILNVKDLSQNFRSNEQRANDQNTQIALLGAKLIALDIKLNNLEAEQKQTSSADRTGKWQMGVALITGGISFVGTIIIAILQLVH